MENLKTFVADWHAHKSMLQQLRQIVFVDEQCVAREDEWDNWDEQATHFLSTENHDTPIATARLLPNGQIGRMAVAKTHRGRGIGAHLLLFVLRWAKDHHYQHLFLHAQKNAIGFYQQLGFVTTSEPYLEAGIVHQSMEYKGSS